VTMKSNKAQESRNLTTLVPFPYTPSQNTAATNAASGKRYAVF